MSSNNQTQPRIGNHGYSSSYIIKRAEEAQQAKLLAEQQVIEELIAKLTSQKKSIEDQTRKFNISRNKDLRGERHRDRLSAKYNTMRWKQMLAEKERRLEPCGLFDDISAVGGLARALTPMVENMTQTTAFGGQQWTVVLQDWLLSGAQLLANPTLTGVTIWFLQILNRFGLTIQVILTTLYRWITMFGERIMGQHAAPPQLPQAQPELRATFLAPDDLQSSVAEFFQGHESAKSISVVVSGASALLACAALGMKSVPQRLDAKVDKFAKAAKTISSCKSGVYAMVAITKDFATWVHEMIEMICANTPTKTFALALREVQFEGETQEMWQREQPRFFEYLAFIRNPKNHLEVMSSKEWRARHAMLFCVTDQVEERLLNGTLTLSPTERQVLSGIRRDLQSIAKDLARNDSLGFVRFTPFWLDISGRPGIGKSVAVPHLSQTIMKVLQKDYVKYNVPSKDDWVHAVNFTDKYLTGYRGQYVVTIDDLFQDQAGAMETSSALQIISWVSSIPHRTNQASLEDKGLPFTSKIIISTSNEKAPYRPEIVSQGALNRRRHMHVEMVHSAIKDPILKREAKFLLLDDTSNLVEKKYDNYTDFCKDLLKKYKDHYATEQEILRTREPDEAFIEELMATGFDPSVGGAQQITYNQYGLAAHNFGTTFVDNGTRWRPASQWFRQRNWEVDTTSEPRLKNFRSLVRAAYKLASMSLHEQQLIMARMDGIPEYFNRFDDNSYYYLLSILGVPIYYETLSTIVDMWSAPDDMLTWDEVVGQLAMLYDEGIDEGAAAEVEPQFGWDEVDWNKHPDSGNETDFGDDTDIDLEPCGIPSMIASGINRFCAWVDGVNSSTLESYRREIAEAIINGDMDRMGFITTECTRTRLRLEFVLGYVRSQYKEVDENILAAFFDNQVMFRSYLKQAQVRIDNKRLHELSEINAGQQSWMRSVKEAISSQTGKVVLGLLSAAAAGALLWKTTRTPKTAQECAIQYQTKIQRAQPRRLLAPCGNEEEIKDCFNVTDADVGAYSLTTKLINRNCVVKLVTNKNYTANGIRIGFQFILANHHFWKKAREDGGFKVFIEGRTAEVGLNRAEDFNDDSYTRIGSKDAGVYYCSANVPAGKSLAKHFSSNKDRVKTTKALLVCAVPSSTTIVNLLAEICTHRNQYEAHGDTYDVLNSYRVNFQVGQGDSGSILVAVDNQEQRKLLGIVACRDTKSDNSYITPITREELELAMDKLKAIKPERVELELDAAGAIMATGAFEGSFIPPEIGNEGLPYLGHLPKEHAMHLPTATKIVPSLIYDPELVTTEPSVLTPKDERLDESIRGQSIVRNNIKGFDREYGPIDTKQLSIASRAIALDIKHNWNVKGIPRRLLTDDEMINGNPTININKVDVHTSAGLGWLKHRDPKKGGKLTWLDEHVDEESGEKTYTPVKSLQWAINFREKQAREGKLLPSISYVCLKDERRVKRKIKNGVTRTFICMPMDYNFLVRKYFGMFCATQHALAGEISSSVGIDAGSQWKKLYDRLRSKGADWEDFDYKEWDRSLHPELIAEYAHIVNTWYGDEPGSPAYKARCVLMYELTYTPLVVQDKLYLKTGGICSGCAITAEINSVIHYLLMYYCYRRIATRLNLVDQIHLDCFKANVEIAVYGDDIVKSCSTEAAWFSGEEIDVECARLGMEITAADKTRNFGVRKPGEVTFLKRRFLKHQEYEELIMAPLDKSVIFDMTQWVHKSDDRVAATEANIDCAIREAFMWGETYYNEFTATINDLIDTKNTQTTGTFVQPVTTAYGDLLDEYRNKGFGFSTNFCK